MLALIQRLIRRKAPVAVIVGTGGANFRTIIKNSNSGVGFSGAVQGGLSVVSELPVIELAAVWLVVNHRGNDRDGRWQCIDDQFKRRSGIADVTRRVGDRRGKRMEALTQRCRGGVVPVAIFIGCGRANDSAVIADGHQRIGCRSPLKGRSVVVGNLPGDQTLFAADVIGYRINQRGVR